MKGTFRATWSQSKYKVYIGDPKEDKVELVIEIDEVTPANLELLAAALTKFRVDWL